MCLAIEIIMSIAGVAILILGKLYLSSELRLAGWRARAAGLLLALPLPVFFGLGVLLTILQEMQVMPEKASVYLNAFELIVFSSMPVLVVIMAILSRPRAANPGWALTDVTAHLAEGKRWLELGYDGLAVNACETAIQANPRSTEAYELLAEIHRCRSDWEASARALQAALELDPRRAANHYRISLCYDQLGRSEQAERERKITLQLDPSYLQAAEDARILHISNPSQPAQGDKP